MNNETINFEGINVTPHKGYYYCPYKCHDPRYPRKKWKTAKGFINHMKSCPKCPSAIEHKKKEDELRISKFEADKALALHNCEYNIGDTIWCVKTVITHPTHVMRGDRRVRIRYEERKTFNPVKVDISSIDFDGSILINGFYRLSDICSSQRHAELRAESLLRIHLEYLDVCERCR